MKSWFYITAIETYVKFQIEAIKISSTHAYNIALSGNPYVDMLYHLFFLAFFLAMQLFFGNATIFVAVAAKV